MRLKELYQDYYEHFGYYPSEEEFKSFLNQYDYDEYENQNNVSPLHRNKTFFDHLSYDDEEANNDFYSQFKILLSEISKSAKQQCRHGQLGEKKAELFFMLLVFMNKISLFLLLKYCHENSIFIDF